MSRAPISPAPACTEIVELRVGPALDSLAALSREGQGPFDVIFIDADKPNNPGYLAGALKLAKRGTLIIADNVVRNGAVADAASTDANVQGVRRFTELVAADKRLEVPPRSRPSAAKAMTASR